MEFDRRQILEGSDRVSLPSMKSATSLVALALLWCVTQCSVLAQTPEWIWSDNQGAAAGETRFFRKVFTVGFEPRQARLSATADDEIIVFLNGKEVGHSTYWKDPISVDVSREMLQG